MLMDWLKGNWRRTTVFFAGLRWFNPQKTVAFLWNPLKTFHRMNGHEAQAIFWMFSGAGPGARFADVSAMSAFGRVNQAPHGTPWRRFGSQRVAASSFHNSLLPIIVSLAMARVLFFALPWVSSVVGMVTVMSSSRASYANVDLCPVVKTTININKAI